MYYDEEKEVLFAISCLVKVNSLKGYSVNQLD